MLKAKEQSLNVMCGITLKLKDGNQRVVPRLETYWLTGLRQSFFLSQGTTLTYNRFWSEEFEHRNSVVSIRHGRILDAGSCEIPECKGKVIRVLDPFIVDKNVAQSITELIFQFFKMECKDAAISLREGVTFRKLTEITRTSKQRKHVSNMRRMSLFAKLDKMKEA
ncbi:hypothetical protein C0995_012168 [Termitomyces sp. Mi166|nr:hypothetical protein C0995_012168 [Termitomyces sp. Mi166\